MKVSVSVHDFGYITDSLLTTILSPNKNTYKSNKCNLTSCLSINKASRPFDAN